MTAKYFSLLTTVGAAKLANAAALGNELAITAMAVGDANGAEPTPNPAQTKLIHECHRAPLNSLRVDPKNPSQVIAEQVLAETVGGWWIREIGLYDAAGDLIAISNCPPSYKPLMAEGSGREQIIRMILIVSSSDAVELKIDPSVVLATREYVDDAIETHAKTRNHPDASTTAKGLVQLSSATNSASETLAATPKAVKAAYDLANGKLSSVPDATTTAKGVVQLSSATNSTSETLAATPKAVKAAYDLANGKLSSVPDATTAAKGIVQLSSATNSTSETLAATPKAVKAAYDLPGASGLGVGPVAKTDAYNNTGQIYRVNNSSANKPPATTGDVSAGVVCLPMDASPSAGYLAVVGGSMAAYVGFSGVAAGGITWARIYTDKFKPTAADINAADVRNNFAAKMGIARVITGTNKPTSPGVWSVENSTWTPYPYGTLYVTTSSADLSATPGNDKFIHYLFIAHGTGNKLFVATDVNGTFGGWFGYVSSKGGAFSGQVIAPNFATTPNAMPVGAGEYADQLSTQAPFFQPNWQWPVTSGGVFVPIAKGTSTRKGKGWPTAVSYGYLMPGTDMHAHPVIHAQGDGGQECIWEFDTQTGGINSKAGAFATIDRDIPPGIIHAWPGETPPAGWLLCNGSGFDRNACPRLAWVFPSGILPDLRGVFLRGKDNGKGYDPNRGLLSIQPGQAPASAVGRGDWANYAGRDTGHAVSVGTDADHNYNVKQETEQQRETRPVNAAINYIVRAA